uniref:Uncharacterized protein n=1 Tax=Bionectria ochroleuca TaxID=29856 RepID=A0A8H7K3D2_BIOOC
MILECLTDLPLVATPGTSDTPGPSAAKDTAERTLDVHKGYRERLEQAWPAAVSMLSDAPSKRPGANRIYEDLEKSGGVPQASNVSLGDSGRELRSHKRRLASEQGIPAQGPDPDAMSWTASLAERLAQRPADWRAREEKMQNAKETGNRLEELKRSRPGRGAPMTSDADPENPAKRTTTANQPNRGKCGR